MEIPKTLKCEFLSVTPPTLFFFVIFCLLIAIGRLILREYNIPLTSFANALVSTLSVGKVLPEAHRHLVEEIVWPHFWLMLYLLRDFLCAQGADSRDRKAGVCRPASWPGIPGQSVAF